VATDWGGFTETIQHGVTGFRCHTLGDFAQALLDARHLDPFAIRRRAIDMYSIDMVKHQYQRYFDRLSLLWGQGWATVTNVEPAPAEACA
jgi:glycosyltransferase involved in cell wall biosynthesis